MGLSFRESDSVLSVEPLTHTEEVIWQIAKGLGANGRRRSYQGPDRGRHHCHERRVRGYVLAGSGARASFGEGPAPVRLQATLAVPLSRERGGVLDLSSAWRDERFCREVLSPSFTPGVILGGILVPVPDKIGS